MMAAAAVPIDADCARVQRKGASHTGISERVNLRLLEAHAVNQPFLNELSNLGRLEYLALEAPVTAADLGPLGKLAQLRILKINSPRIVSDFAPIVALPRLERLFIENAKHMPDLKWLGPLEKRLRVLGIEGSTWTPQRVSSIRPLEGFQLDALFLTNTILGDQSLASLRRMSRLRYLGTARNAPRAEFDALHKALPQLHCDWFQSEMWGRLDDLISGKVKFHAVQLALPETLEISLPPRQ